MRVFVILVLCISQVAVDADVGVFSSSTTNAETGAILTTDIFTRDGQTNLIRVAKIEKGVVVQRRQRFYHNSEPIAFFSMNGGIESFSTLPKIPFQVSVEFSPSKDIRCLIIWGSNFMDGFYNTNGVFYPAPDSDLEFHGVKNR